MRKLGLSVVAAALAASATIALAEPVGEFCGPRAPSFTCGDEVCVTACMTPAQWAACTTKSWWADDKLHTWRKGPKYSHYKTPRFFERCGTVCRPFGFPNLGYKTAGGEWVVFRFPAR